MYLTNNVTPIRWRPDVVFNVLARGLQATLRGTCPVTALIGSCALSFIAHQAFHQVKHPEALTGMIDTGNRTLGARLFGSFSPIRLVLHGLCRS